MVSQKNEVSLVGHAYHRAFFLRTKGKARQTLPLCALSLWHLMRNGYLKQRRRSGIGRRWKEGGEECFIAAGGRRRGNGEEKKIWQYLFGSNLSKIFLGQGRKFSDRRYSPLVKMGESLGTKLILFPHLWIPRSSAKIEKMTLNCPSGKTEKEKKNCWSNITLSPQRQSQQ